MNTESLAALAEVAWEKAVEDTKKLTTIKELLQGGQESTALTAMREFFNLSQGVACEGGTA
jgi:hypothetical protein